MTKSFIVLSLILYFSLNVYSQSYLFPSPESVAQQALFKQHHSKDVTSQYYDVINNYQNLRKLFDDTFLHMIPMLPDTKVEDADINTSGMDDCGFKLRGKWITAPGVNNGKSSGVILYFHGGGSVVGGMKMNGGMASRLSKSTGRKMLLLEYDLFPETPLLDIARQGLCSYRWLIETEKYKSSQVVILGDSSGGAMALRVMQMMIVKDMPVPAGAVLISPITDFSFSGESFKTNEDLEFFANDYMITTKGAHWIAGKLPLQHPSISPLFGDFQKMPPLFFLCGANDIFLSDTTRTAHKARVRGVQVRTEIVAFQGHEYVMYDFPESIKSRENIKVFVDQVMNQPVNIQIDL